MKAVIMAGGEGTRLRPLTCTFPKPLAHVCGEPIMHYVVDLLAENGISEAAVTLMYLGDMIRDHFGEEYHGVRLTYFTEDKPLGTAGSVKNTMDFIGEDEDFLVISADAMCDFDLKALVSFHKEKGADVTIALSKADDPLEYGIVLSDEKDRVVRFVEKPGWPQAFADTVNTGVYVVKTKAMQRVPKGESFDFSKDLFPLLLHGENGICSKVMDGYWCDVGGLSALKSCADDVLTRKVKANVEAETLEGSFYRGDVPPGAYTIAPPCYIGQNVSIGEGAVIGPFAVIDDGCVVKSGAVVKRSVLYPNVSVSEGAEVKGAILAKNVAVGKSARLFEGACIGEGSIIGKNTLIKSGIKVWPGKHVEEDGVLTQNLVWGDASRRLFGETGVTGEFSTHITAEFSAKLGACIGSFYVKKDIVLLDDGKTASNVIKNALKTGLLSSGARVFDIGKASLPMGMFAVSYFDGAAGVLFTSDEENVDIRPFDKDEPTLPRGIERKIENAFFSDDFLRVGAKNVCPSVEISNIGPLYGKYLESLAFGKIKGLHLSLDACAKAYTPILKYVFERLLGHVEDGEGHIGVIVSEDGMRFSLTDETGQAVSYDKCLGVLSNLLFEKGEHLRLRVPCTAPFFIDDAALRYDGKIIRVPNYPLEAPGQEGRVELGFIDGCAGAVKLISLLYASGRTLHDAAGEVKDGAFVTKDVKTDKSRGYIMRKLAQMKGRDMEEFAEGIEFCDQGGRVLIIPSRQTNAFRVYAGAKEEKAANALAEDFAKRIESL